MSALAIWTVYDHPLDYPNDFVARRFEIGAGGHRPTASIIVAPDLETLRRIFLTEMHLTCLARHPADDPKIVECWL